MDIPLNQTWKGKTTKGFGNKFGSNPNISISKVSDNNYQISDYSGGLFEQLGFGSDHSVEITIDCNKQVKSSEMISNFGEVVITGGNWDTESKSLTIHWSIPFNHLTETTIVTLN